MLQTVRSPFATLVAVKRNFEPGSYSRLERDIFIINVGEEYTFHSKILSVQTHVFISLSLPKQLLIQRYE
jgi:hypothetical protein